MLTMALTMAPVPKPKRQLRRTFLREWREFRNLTQEQAAERPERLAAETLLAFLIHHDDAFASGNRFRCRDEAGKAGSDDEDIGLGGHVDLPAAAAGHFAGRA